MIRVPMIILALVLLIPPAAAQQNQTPGDTDAGGNSRAEASGLTAAHSAQAGANTSDATTTGASGPANKKASKPGPIALPPLPSEKQCSGYEGDVRAACLSTVLNTTAGAAP